MHMYVLRKSHTWFSPRGTHVEYSQRPNQPTGSYNIKFPEISIFLHGEMSCITCDEWENSQCGLAQVLLDVTTAMCVIYWMEIQKVTCLHTSEENIIFAWSWTTYNNSNGAARASRARATLKQQNKNACKEDMRWSAYHPHDRTELLGKYE